VRFIRSFAAVSILAIIPSASSTITKADRIRDDQWHLQSLQIARVHEVSTGKGVMVAVLDTGVYPHFDLKQNLSAGTNIIDGSNNGRVDTDGHGTEMAGLIAAHGRNSIDGVLGIAPSATILPVKNSDIKENGTSVTFASAIEWAVTHDAKVINFSAAAEPSIALNKAIEVAAARDVVVVAGSGNKPDFLSFGYPAAMPGVLAVGATDRQGKHASFSIGGPQMQICAPGVDITTTGKDGKYFDITGTSPATAIVSGAAALVRSKFPELSAPEVIHRLTATATDIGPPGRDDECGFGELNILKALTAHVPPLQPTPTPTPPSNPPTAAAPAPTPSGVNIPAVVGGLLGGLGFLGLLVGLGVRRRARRP
jgi:type VII secretion-associated serine protease mycosin